METQKTTGEEPLTPPAPTPSFNSVFLLKTPWSRQMAELWAFEA
jgi:hypothetical protein